MRYYLKLGRMDWSSKSGFPWQLKIANFAVFVDFKKKKLKAQEGRCFWKTEAEEGQLLVIMYDAHSNLLILSWVWERTGACDWA